MSPTVLMDSSENVVNLDVNSHVDLKTIGVDGFTFLLAFGRASQVRRGVVLASELLVPLTCQQDGLGQFQWQGQLGHPLLLFMAESRAGNERASIVLKPEAPQPAGGGRQVLSLGWPAELGIGRVAYFWGRVLREIRRG